MDRVLQVKRFHQCREVVGVGIHFVAAPRLARSAMAAAVMADAAVSVGAQKHHLVLPGVRAQRPAVAEDHGLATAPVLVVDLRAVFRRYRGHGMLSLSVAATKRHTAKLSLTCACSCRGQWPSHHSPGRAVAWLSIPLAWSSLAHGSALSAA